MFLYGKNSVIERLKAAPATMRQLFLREDFDDPAVMEVIRKSGVKFQKLPEKKLPKFRPGENLQGIVAEVEEFKYADIEDILENKKLVPIFLDRVFDPQNLGAIMRSAACFGGFGIVIPAHKACSVTETVLKVACGAENYLPVAQPANLTNAILEAKERGFWIAGAVADAEKDISREKLPFPLALALGSEGEGVRYGVDKHLDLRLCIPTPGAGLSLNVAQACAICCYEIVRQRARAEEC